MSDGAVSSFKAEEAAAYDGTAERFAALSERYAGDLAVRLVGIARIGAGDRVLDVGTGAGVVAAAAAGKVGTTGRIVGIDISEAMLAMARQGATARGLDERIQYQLMDAEALELEDGSRDVVVSLFALLHLPDPLRALQQMRRVLRPGGRLVAGVGSGAPVSIAGLAHRLRRLGTLWGVKRGRCLVAPEALESLLRSRLGPEEAAAARWHEHARAHRPAQLGALAREAGFIRVQVSWEGRDLAVTTAEEFWDLQRTFSSVARLRLAAASPEAVADLRHEMMVRSEAVLARGGKLIYPQGVLVLRALRPAP